MKHRERENISIKNLNIFKVFHINIHTVFLNREREREEIYILIIISLHCRMYIFLSLDLSLYICIKSRFSKLISYKLFSPKGSAGNNHSLIINFNI